MNNKVVAVWKPIGWTPLVVIDEFKNKSTEYKNETVSYAGRLDPMAEGVMVMLIGDENKNRKVYEDMEKEYEAEFVLGIETDTFDGLGIVGEVSTVIPSQADMEKHLGLFLGEYEQTYPPYSSKPVKGRPLFWWARQGRISEIEMPKKRVTINSIQLLESETLSGSALMERLVPVIKAVKGDFRQEEILNAWKTFSDSYGGSLFMKVRIIVRCSSGTYIRGIASEMGKALGCGAFALSITRTRVGDFTKEMCLDIMSRHTQL